MRDSARDAAIDIDDDIAVLQFQAFIVRRPYDQQTLLDTEVLPQVRRQFQAPPCQSRSHRASPSGTDESVAMRAIRAYRP